MPSRLLHCVIPAFCFRRLACEALHGHWDQVASPESRHRSDDIAIHHRCHPCVLGTSIDAKDRLACALQAQVEQIDVWKLGDSGLSPFWCLRRRINISPTPMDGRDQPPTRGMSVRSEHQAGSPSSKDDHDRCQVSWHQAAPPGMSTTASTGKPRWRQPSKMAPPWLAPPRLHDGRELIMTPRRAVHHHMPQTPPQRWLVIAQPGQPARDCARCCSPTW